MTNKVILGQIGVGYWGPNLIRNLYKNEKCIIKTVVDISKDRLSEIKKEYNSIEISTDIGRIINDKDISAVVIATPVETHYDLSMKILESGKHILVEKPMAKTVNEVDDILRLSENNDLIAMVGHTFLYNPAIQISKKLIKSKSIGELRYIICERTNLGKVRTDVDALWNLAPHDVSIIQYFVDDIYPIDIKKHGMSFLQKGVDDVSFMELEYENNIRAHIHVSWLDPIKTRRIKIIGSKKMIIFDDTKNDKLIVLDKSVTKDRSNKDTSFIYKDGGNFVQDIDEDEPLALEIAHFVDCIISNKKCLTDANHAKKVIKILSAENS